MTQRSDPARPGREVAGRVLGRQPDLDRVADRLGRAVCGGQRAGRQRLAGGQPELLVDDVEPGDQLGDAVLDLEPGVDLEEVEGAVAASRRNSAVAAFWSPAAVATRTARSWRWRRSAVDQARGRRLLDELLVASLERAVALADGDDRARSRRPAAGPRCGARAGSRAPGRPTRRRTPTPPRPIPLPAPPAGPAARATRRIPRPPPPAAALTSSGKPIRSASARIAGTASGRSTGTGSSGPGDALDADRPGEPAGLDLVAERLDRPPTAARRRRGRRPRRLGRTPPARTGSRSPDGSPRRRWRAAASTIASIRR